MRLFVALDLPAETRKSLGSELERARGGLPAARWTPLEQLHVTLLFLGETPAEAQPELDRALGEACSRSAGFQLEVAGGGSFPVGGAARILWIGAEAGPALPELQQKIEQAVCGVLHRGPERRAFHAHVTVARCRSPWPRREAARFHEALRGYRSGPFEVESAVLVESQLASTGATHRRLTAYPLRAA